jgi:hypothetical protein
MLNARYTSKPTDVIGLLVDNIRLVSHISQLVAECCIYFFFLGM